MTKKDNLSGNNINDSKQPELNTENDNENKDYFDNETSEVITLGLYNTISSVIFNVISNSVSRNIIKNNSNILKLLELQISNLFFLESELKSELKNNKHSRNFLQIISDITELELSVNKSPKKNRTEILEDSNLLIITLINIGKGIERESLERIRTIDENSFKELTNQISALDGFSIENENVQQESEPPVAGLNSLNNGTNPNLNGNLNNPNNINNLNPNMNLNNLTNLGLLPQHPASNPNFYPYLSKPSAVPKLRKILVAALAVSMLFIITTIIISFFVKGKIQISQGKDPQDFSLSQAINVWYVTVVTILIFSWAIYEFLKPTKIKRETYHTSLFVLVILAVWIGFIVSFCFLRISDGFLKSALQRGVKKGETFNEDALNQLKNLANFPLFKIFSIITGSISILPILILVILILINPRIDRNKIIRANTEYQNAISAAMNGQKYDIDQSLFDKEEKKDHKRRKTQFSGRF